MSINPNIAPSQHSPSTHSAEGAVTLFEIFELLGKRSFVPFIAVPALIGLTPLGQTMAFAALAGLVLITVGVQLLMGYAFPALPRKIAELRFSGRLAQYFTLQLFETKQWFDEVHIPRMSWLTTSVFAALPYLMLVVVGVALPILIAMGQPIMLICISALIYSVALLTRDGRYILASASVLSIASIGPVFQFAT